MITLRLAGDRGSFDHGWLRTWHTFSFGDYRDPEHLGFRSLRVINEDIISPGSGFGEHPHSDMEIITWVLEGALEHRDSLGNGGILRPGDVQVMSAGTGIIHSEFNHSSTTPVHLIQIWIRPRRKGYPPSYLQRSLPLNGRLNILQKLASSDGSEDSIQINQDASVSVIELDGRVDLEQPIDMNDAVWVHVTRGAVAVNGHHLNPGDAAGITGEPTLRLVAQQTPSQVLVFVLS